MAQGPGLPPGYQVQPIDSPLPVTNGGFGNAMIPIGDVDGDGTEDFAHLQAVGTLNGDGVVWQFSGATGRLLRSANVADSGGAGARASGDRFLGRMDDLGSCANAPTPDPTQPGPTCASPTVGPPDGVKEILVGGQGVDVAGVRDVGRIYVLDGRTLAVLKRVDMPPDDRAQIASLAAANPTLTNIQGGFGRSVTSPRGLPPCAGNAGVGPCLPQTAMPQAVRIGDTDGGGVPDIVVGANQFPETAATAHPESNCAKTGASLCATAGRVYTYRGEDVAGSDPSVILDGTGPGQTPPKILKSLAAQADDPFSPRTAQENFGHSQMPVGDLGTCRTGGAFPAVAAGERCVAASRTIVPDGRPDYIVIAQRADFPLFNPDPSFTEVGVAFLIDGATGAVLFVYDHPEPQKDALFGFTTGQQFPVGDLGDTNLPDVVLAGFQNAGDKAQAGRAYVFSGNFTANFIQFAVLDDPTPNIFGRYGNPTEGVGDLVPARARNEVLIGQFSAVQTAGRADTKFDVSFVNPSDQQVLQTISDPDAQDESGFGSRVMPLGDLNGDGFLDFSVSSVRWDAPAAGGAASVLDQGRAYVFRSDRNAVVPPTPGPPAGPAGAAGPAGPPAAAGPAGPPGGPAGPGTAATVLAGRTVDLDASRTRVTRGTRVQLRGAIEAFANPAACERRQRVQIQQRAKTGGRFKTFLTVTSTTTGTFRTIRFAPRSTQLYRARVVQTAACQGAQSRRETVTVVKPKRSGRAG
ncbi:MAG: hypothetical protein AVDCRST_MAG53-1786 [uncultured Solirubrobacteraceae bacterium]|uniref:Uncharacterized protein n=2 Tax=uncultured Solirubrobacteraceae bacterium TaxID=1162706 RepID=A0A6J4SDA4_9ACTN|nr:MAG: hypothetical protein AVDCRST_MAG53-1786 [uncultured Solirubrobacteraceae bacterium]